MPNINSLELNRAVTGYHQVTDLTSAIQCPGTGSAVEIQAEAVNIRYRLDGIDPTTTEGSVIAAGDCIIVNIGDGNIKDIRLIGVAAGAIANVHAFR